MKDLKNWERILLLAAAAAVLFTAGVVVGRKTAPVSITLERLETAPPEDTPAPSAAEPVTEPSLPLNVNTASAAELSSLEGVGEKLAKAIVTWRQEHGPFRSLSELLSVPGMDRDTLAALRPLLTID